MAQRSQAFVKGGCGCLLAFAALGAFAVLAGGRVRITCGGMAFLFVGGGILGLMALAVFKKRPPEGPPEFSPAPPRRVVWTCLACASDNEPDARFCRNCNEPR